MKERIITAIIAGFFFLTFVLIGGLPFTIFIYILATIGLYEILKMKRIGIVSVHGIFSLIFLWLLMYPLPFFSYTKMEVATIVLFSLLSLTVLTKNEMTFDHAAFIFFSTMYIGIGFYSFILIREAGLMYVFFILFAIWANDSGAYFVGRAFGKRKLWPKISPNKTVEGAIGGIISALIVAVLFHFFADIRHSLSVLLAFAMIIAVFGQIGDLVESAYKRHYLVKDSGQLLPGHGGILDRFDSLLFVSPILLFLHFS